jgi:hypothetical protein
MLGVVEWIPVVLNAETAVFKVVAWAYARPKMLPICKCVTALPGLFRKHVFKSRL